MIFEYPYTDMYRLNLDWMLKAIKEVQTIIDNLGSVVNTINGMTGDVVLTRDILTEILGSVVHSVNGMSGDVTLTKAYLTTLLDGVVNTFNGRTGTVSLTAADVNQTMIDITWTSDPGDTINSLSQTDLDELYAAGKRVLIFLNNLSSPDQIFFLTMVGSVVTPQPYTPTGAISGVASFNGLTGAVTATAETLPLDDQTQDTIADELDDINVTLSSQSQQIANLQLADYDSSDKSLVFRSSDAATYDSATKSIIINI